MDHENRELEAVRHLSRDTPNLGSMSASQHSLPGGLTVPVGIGIYRQDARVNPSCRLRTYIPCHRISITPHGASYMTKVSTSLGKLSMSDDDDGVAFS